MKERVLLSAMLVAATISTGAVASPPCEDPADPVFGSHACKVYRLQQRSFVVIAVADTGINPYHADFRLPNDDDLTGVHPSEFIEGFPSDAEAFELALDRDSYAEALAADREEWDAMPLRALRTFPGTKIIAGISFDNDGNYSGHILDEHGHGTRTSSLAGGLIHGSNDEVEALVVSVQGVRQEAVIWALSQPWIDIVSVSAKCPVYQYSTDCSILETSRAFTDGGGIAVFSSGNGPSPAFSPPGLGPGDPSILNPWSGAPWHLVVGAASTRSDQPTSWHSIMPDVIGYGDYVLAADHESLAGETAFSGTSAATPIVAGVASSLALDGRRLLHDTTEGPHQGNLASGAPSTGLLTDGFLSRLEVEEAVQKTAIVAPFEPQQLHWYPWILPNTPGYYLFGGYGVVNQRSQRDALAVLRGEMAMPDRSDVDSWMETRDTIAGLIWGAM